MILEVDITHYTFYIDNRFDEAGPFRDADVIFAVTNRDTELNMLQIVIASSPSISKIQLPHLQVVVFR